MTGVLIRPARVDDAQGMIDVLNPIIRAGGTTAIESEYTLDAQRAYLGGIGPGAACHVAEDAAIGEIIGFQSYESHPALPDHIADIATFVLTGRARRGVGRLLCEATFRAARADGYAEMNATIRADNFAGLAFYARMGFRDVCVDRARPLRSGRKVDRISKRRALS